MVAFTCELRLFFTLSHSSTVQIIQIKAVEIHRGGIALRISSCYLVTLNSPFQTGMCTGIVITGQSKIERKCLRMAVGRALVLWFLSSLVTSV